MFRPIKVFAYRDVVPPLFDILRRPDILKQCNQWHLRQSRNQMLMQDVYDGRMWNEYLSVEGRPFLSEESNLALALDVDWFRPFEHS